MVKGDELLEMTDVKSWLKPGWVNVEIKQVAFGEDPTDAVPVLVISGKMQGYIRILLSFGSDHTQSLRLKALEETQKSPTRAAGFIVLCPCSLRKFSGTLPL